MTILPEGATWRSCLVSGGLNENGGLNEDGGLKNGGLNKNGGLIGGLNENDLNFLGNTITWWPRRRALVRSR